MLLFALRKIGAGIVLPLLLALLAASISFAEKGMKIAPYDAELYESGYTIFLMNGNVKDALALAESALAVHPDDAAWRRRAATCADWANEPAKALEHWFYLAVAKNDQQAYTRALQIAVATGDLPRKKVLLRHVMQKDYNLETLKDFVRTAETLGDIDEIITLLEKVKRGRHRKYALETLPRLYEAAGCPDKAIAAYREYGKNYPPSPSFLLRLSALQFGRGDLPGAYKTLKSGQQSLGSASKEYLESLADVCWAMQDIDCSANACRKLIAAGYGREVDYQRLTFSLQRNSLPGAFETAKAGWDKFRKPVFFFQLADIGESLAKWEELHRFVSNLNADEREMLAKQSSYWLLRSRIYQHLGRPEDSLTAYREAVRLDPLNGEIAAGYIWLLLDLEKKEELKPFTARWMEMDIKSAELIDALGSAAFDLGEGSNALMLFRKRFAARKDDPLWISAYADVLDQNNLTETAFSQRARAYSMLRGKVDERKTRSTEQEGLARFLMHLQKGDFLDNLLGQIIQSEADDSLRELVAAWSMTTEKNDFARFWLWRAYARSAKKPAWVQLELALEQNDRPMMADLLHKKKDDLPYRDAIEGARKTGAFPFSEEMAWRSSWQNPDDYLLYKQVQEIFSGHPSYAGYRLRLLDRGGIGGIENSVRFSIPITTRFSLLSQFSHTLNSELKSGVLDNLPSSDIAGMVGFVAHHQKGLASLSAGWRSAVGDLPTFGATGTYRLTENLELGGELSYSSAADESVPLLIGGVRDRLALTLTRTLTERDTIQAGFAYSYLRDQWRRPLGEGQHYSVDYSHKLLFENPDLYLRLFGGYDAFAQTAAPQGKTLSLIPEGAPHDASFFIPDSYFHAGAGVSFGQDYRSLYAKGWKPFGSLDISWRSDTDIGYGCELGFHGPVFGYDSLYFLVSTDSGAFSTSDLSTVIEMGYTYFFN